MKDNKKQNIINFILEELLSGSLKANSQIPTEAELAEKYETSIATAHRAVKYLEDANIVERVKGKGTFILENTDASTFGKLKDRCEKKIHIILPLNDNLHVHWQDATLSSLETTLQSSGYKIFYFEYDDSKGSPEEFNEILQEIISSGSNGIVISTVRDISYILGNNKRLLVEKQIPLFVHNITGEYIPDIICNMVSQDPYSDGVLIGRLLVKHSYDKVLFIGSHKYSDEKYESPDFWLQTRIRGVTFGLGAESDDIKFEIVKTREQYGAICQRIKNIPGSTCIVGVNVELSADFIDVAKENGLECPLDFELISFDDNPKFLKYNITALVAPFEKIGRTMGQIICNNNSLFQSNHIWVKVPYEYRERQTFKAIENKLI